MTTISFDETVSPKWRQYERLVCDVEVKRIDDPFREVVYECFINGESIGKIRRAEHTPHRPSRKGSRIRVDLATRYVFQVDGDRWHPYDTRKAAVRELATRHIFSK